MGALGAFVLLSTGTARGQIEEIVVTARKRAESSLTVPVAVTAVPIIQLERQGAKDIEDLEGLAPNLVIDPVRAGPQGAGIAIRGVSFEDIEKSFEPAVGVVIDGIYIGTNTGQLVNMFDFESVEVLRGPQGTLFGKNTPGGVINIRRTHPTGELGFRGLANYGSFGRNDYHAVVNLPTWKDLVAVKGFYFDSNFGGFYDNVTLDRRRGAIEDRNYGLTAHVTPWEKLSVLATVERLTQFQHLELGTVSRTPAPAEYLDVNNGPEIAAELASGDLPGALAAGLKNIFVPDTICAARIPGVFAPEEECDRNSGEDLYTTFSEIPGFSEYEVFSTQAEIAYDFGDWTVTSLSGWRESDERSIQDFDASSIEFFWTDRPQDYEQFSQELRANGRWRDWLDLTVGVYYWYAFYHIDFVLNTSFSPDPITSFVDHDTDSVAGFFDAVIHLSERWNLGFGGRHTYEKKKIHSILPDSAFTVGGDVQLEDSWSEFTPKATLDYTPWDASLAYFSYQRGFRSGGFNGRATTPTSVGPYDPEFVDSYELGYKTLTFGSRLALNAAAFYTNYTDKQEEIVRLVSTISGNPQETVVENVASARIWGLELDANAELFEGLNLLGAVGYLNAEYLEFEKDLDGDGTVDDATSLEMRRTPDWTASLGATHTVPIGATFLATNVTYRYVDDYETTIIQDPEDPTTNDRRLTAPAHNNVTAHMALSFPWGPSEVRLGVFGRNLLDEKGLVAGLPVAGLMTFAAGRPPRMFGGEVAITY